MSQGNRDVIADAIQRLGPEREPLLRALQEHAAENLSWYLQHKIVDAPDEAFRDHERVLKYAYNLCRKGANVTFLMESAVPGERTPDLGIRTDEFGFLLEVKKFGMSPSGARVAAPGDPVSKIVDAVRDKRGQLRGGNIGIVAIDNFSLPLESGSDGLTHDHVFEALCELERHAANNSSGWSQPSAVVVSAMSTGGVVAITEGDGRGLAIPHFLWINPQAKPAMPARLANWIASALPNSRSFREDVVKRTQVRRGNAS